MGRKPLDIEFLSQRPFISTERHKVVVAFGDLSDFAAWTKLGSNSPEAFRDLMVEVYTEIVKFRNGSGYFLKLLGDGFMAADEVPETGAKMSGEFVKGTANLSRSIGSVVRRHFPHPGIFRVRTVAGYVWKITAKSAKGRTYEQTDFIGYPVNLAARLLQVRRDVPCIAHQSVRELVSIRHLQFRKLRVSEACPRGIDSEDLQALSAYTFRDR